jgi:hypothetical protein
MGFSILWKIWSNMGCKSDFLYNTLGIRRSLQVVIDGNIVYFRGVPLIWSYCSQMQRPILVWNVFMAGMKSWIMKYCYYCSYADVYKESSMSWEDLTVFLHLSQLFPWNPCAHVHWKPPGTLISLTQVAPFLQGFFKHSSASTIWIEKGFKK